MSEAKNNSHFVLVFNNMQRYVGFFLSVYAASKSVGAHPSSIKSACVGETIACKGQYFRYLNDDIEVTTEDLGVLTLKEYDELCETKRKTYPNRKMTRNAMKYRKVPKCNPYYPFKKPQQ